MTALVSLRGVSKSFAGIRVLKDVDFDVRARRGARAPRRERRRQVDADQDHRRRARPGRRHHPHRRRGARRPSPRARRSRAASPPSTRSSCSSPSSPSPRTSSSATRPTPGSAPLDWTPDAPARPRSSSTRLDSHDLDVDAKVGTLSVANRQRVEIAKALSQNARVLIMDEPTAALADADVRRLMVVVKRLRERGVGIIYVSHKLPEIFELADRVTVLRDGALIGTRPIAEVNEQTLVAMMVGREIDHLFPKPEPNDRRDDPQGRRPRPSATASATSPSSSAAARSSAGRPRRLRPHRARADDLRHHPGHLRHHRARRPPGRPSPRRARPATSASPTCPRTAACRASSGR